MRRATGVAIGAAEHRVISTHALREEGDQPFQLLFVVPLLISTHALREEGDGGRPPEQGGGDAISTHALREEGDAIVPSVINAFTDFYPRPP